jgi:two-component system sensor histidine kinase UhpB
MSSVAVRPSGVAALAPATGEGGAHAGEPAYLAGPPLFWRLLAANLLVVLGGAVVGTTLTRAFVLRGAFTPLTHALMVLAAIGLSALLTAVILHMAFRPLRALRLAIARGERPGAPEREALTRDSWLGDPDILAVADAVQGLWDRLDQHVRLLQESNRQLEAQRAELAEKTVQLRTLATQVLAAQEEERRRLARELHDDTMQSLAALIMGLERGLEAMPAHQPHVSEAHHTVGKLRDLAVGLLDELRHLTLDLRPAVLDDHGLPAALRWLAQTHQERTGLGVEFEDVTEAACRAGEHQLPPPVETALYRIAQEALSNATRHAHAGRVRLTLDVSDGEAVVEVADDGSGFDTTAPRDGQQMGLFNMRERAALLGGALEVRSSPRGTLVRARIPAFVPAGVASVEAAGAGASW